METVICPETEEPCKARGVCSNLGVCDPKWSPTRLNVPGAKANPNWKSSNPKDAAAAVQGRVPLGLFPDTARIAGAMSMWEGANKYGQYNYRVVGVRASVYLDALDRHVSAYRNGEDIDPDSGLPHTWKALACLAVLIDAEECGKLEDDRPPRAPVAERLKSLQGTVQDIRERLEDYEPHQYTIEDSPDD